MNLSRSFHALLGSALVLSLSGCLASDEDTDEDALSSTSATIDISAYQSGVWGVPASGELTGVLTIPAQSCADQCAASAACTGFYAFTDRDRCQLYGPGADTAAHSGAWVNVKMHWKTPTPDPLVRYHGAVAPLPNTHQLGGSVSGYRPYQCARMCDASPACTGFHAFTDRDACQLYGAGAATASSQGPWSNVKMYWKPAATDVDATYRSGIWAIPATGELAGRLLGMSAQSCADQCAASGSCTGFYAITDANVCQLYGPGADTAGRGGSWANVRMHWKTPSPDPAGRYDGAVAPLSNTGMLGSRLYGYQPYQCALMCDTRTDCTGFYAFTDWDVCQLYGAGTSAASTQGPWSNVKLYRKPAEVLDNRETGRGGSWWENVAGVPMAQIFTATRTGFLTRFAYRGNNCGSGCKFTLELRTVEAGNPGQLLWSGRGTGWVGTMPSFEDADMGTVLLASPPVLRAGIDYAAVVIPDHRERYYLGNAHPGHAMTLVNGGWVRLALVGATTSDLRFETWVSPTP